MVKLVWLVLFFVACDVLAGDLTDGRKHTKAHMKCNQATRCVDPFHHRFDCLTKIPAAVPRSSCRTGGRQGRLGLLEVTCVPHESQAAGTRNTQFNSVLLFPYLNCSFHSMIPRFAPDWRVLLQTDIQESQSKQMV
jgi:hypothetical protein